MDGKLHKMAVHVHTIPVDKSLTPEEAWKEICIMGFRTTSTGGETWANILCDGEECRNIRDNLS
jgi:hypothetical protein